ncbi:hypothetical protein [Cupriavidus oxalaticus]|uniref:hypothetical protein n=1 Tax=Cupriavidus oxalaticus TaxID=96344 RepID=UPI00317B4B32
MLIIDPYLFCPDNIKSEYDRDRIQQIKEQLHEIISICRKFNWKVIFDRKGWRNIELNFIRKITAQCQDADLNVALSALRRDFLQMVDIDGVEGIRTWGIKPLFNGVNTPIDSDFADSVARSASISFEHYGRALLFVREIEGRNITTRAAGNSYICERTRWRIYFSKTGLNGAIPVPCVTRVRNVSVEWTARYDVGLPDCGRYAFQPSAHWHLRRTVVVGVMQAKPVFLDTKANGWAKPNTPGAGYHWDVYLSDREWIDAIRLTQINVCRSDVPASQGAPGEIHHIPAAKAGRARA